MRRRYPNKSSTKLQSSKPLTWKLITPDQHDKNSPAPRQGHTSTAFPRRNFFIIFGGQCSNTQLSKSNFSKKQNPNTNGRIDGKTFFFNDCYKFECKTKTWSPLSCTGDIPSSRAHHSAVAFDNTRLVIMGGTNGRARLNDVYRLNLGTLIWQRINVTNTSLNSYQIHSSLMLPSFPNQIFIFGASNNKSTGGQFNQTLINVSLNIDQQGNSTLEAFVSTGDVPPSRSHYSFIIYENNIIIFGGFDGTTRYNDVRIFNPSNNTWTEMETMGDVPDGRYKHASCVFGEYMIVVGGYSTRWLNDVCLLHLKTGQWTKIEFNHGNEDGNGDGNGNNDGHGHADGSEDKDKEIDGIFPRPRESHTVTLVGTFVYVFGGWSWPSAMNDMYRFRAGRIVRRLKVIAGRNSSLKHAVVRKIPSTGSIMMTELVSPGGKTGGLSGLVVHGTRQSNQSNNKQEDEQQQSPMFSLRNKAFRSSHDRRQMHDKTSTHRRSNSNLLVARKTSSPLPNIQQLTQDSDDEDEEEINTNTNSNNSNNSNNNNKNHSNGGNGNIGGSMLNGRRKKYQKSNLTIDDISIDDTKRSTPPPARSSLSPVTKAASSRRKEYMRMKSGGDSNSLSNRSMKNGNFLNEEQKVAMRNEVNRRVEASVTLYQTNIAEQEQRKIKAEHGLNALNDMLLQLDKETDQLKVDVRTAKEEKKKLGADFGKKTFQQAFAMEIETKTKMDESSGKLKKSQENICSLKEKLKEQSKQKERIAEMSLHLNQQIATLKKRIQRQDEHRKTEPEDGINESIQLLTQKVDQQGATRRMLTTELNTLKENQTKLKKQIEEQLQAFKQITYEEESLRESVQSMVTRLAGSGEATEEKPYEKMSASMFGNSLQGGMLISR